MLNILKELVIEICNENDIKYKFLSREWIVRLEKSNKLAYIVGPRFSINSVTGATIASDKYATYKVLKNANIPVIEHKMIFNSKYREGYVSDLNSIEEIKEYLNSQPNKRVVVKANKGSCGKSVFLCKNINEIQDVIDKLFLDKESLSICPFYEIEAEYRVICFDEECKLIYGKKTAEGNWKHNLSEGAVAFEVNDKSLKDKLKNIAKSALKEIGLRFGCVDIIEVNTGELLIIEVNSGVTINKYIEFNSTGREIAKKIYGEVIKEMLK